jgi:hypothetical protein
MNKKYILFIGLFLILSLGLGMYFYFFYSVNQPTSRNISNQNSKSFTERFFETKPVYENPLTGEKFLTDSKPEFLNHKPLGVMINNANPARPQAGISKADLVYEIVAEGGITRFLAIFYSELPEKVGPIRSVREYYLVIVKELGDSMLMHIGYSPQALQKIKEWNVLSLGLAGADFYRDNRGNPEIATEHTAFANSKDLFNFGKSVNYDQPLNLKAWKFNESFDSTNLLEAKNIQIDFWYEGDYSGFFKFDSSRNEYIRYSGLTNNNPQILIDDLTKSEVRVKNVIVQFAEEFPIPNDDKNRLDYQMVGTGKALIFRDGYVINGSWKKDSLNDRTLFYNSMNQEVEFNRGKIWVSVVPSRNENQVKYTQ